MEENKFNPFTVYNLLIALANTHLRGFFSYIGRISFHNRFFRVASLGVHSHDHHRASLVPVVAATLTLLLKNKK